MGEATSIEDLLSQESSLLNPLFHQQPPPQMPSHTTTTTTTTQASTTTTTNSPLFSCFPSNPQSLSASSPSSSTSAKRKTSPDHDNPDSHAAAAAAVVLKRQRNTLAARKYRQKRLDRIAELEKALADVTGDRDDLRLKLARKEAEVDALREMMKK